MAKRAPANEGPYRPLLDPAVLTAALTNAAPASKESSGKGSQATVLELKQAEEIRRQVRPVGDEAQRQFIGEARQGIPSQIVVEKLDQEKRLLLTKAESLALERLVNSLASRVNTQVKLSHVLRALVMLVLHAEAQIDRRASETIGLIRPANGDFKGLQRFEREIATILANAFRDAGPVRD